MPDPMPGQTMPPEGQDTADQAAQQASPQEQTMLKVM